MRSNERVREEWVCDPVRMVRVPHAGLDELSCAVRIVVLVVVLICCGCVRALSPVTATRVAVERSNEEARRLYEVEPFTEKDGELRKVDDQWVWQALTSATGRDMIATVALDRNGSVLGLDVRMLVHPDREAPTTPGVLPVPDVKPEDRPGIPEVMPE